MATTVAAPAARRRTSPLGADVAALAVALGAFAAVALAVNHLLLTAW